MGLLGMDAKAGTGSCWIEKSGIEKLCIWVVGIGVVGIGVVGIEMCGMENEPIVCPGSGSIACPVGLMNCGFSTEEFTFDGVTIVGFSTWPFTLEGVTIVGFSAWLFTLAGVTMVGFSTWPFPLAGVITGAGAGQLPASCAQTTPPRLKTAATTTKGTAFMVSSSARGIRVYCNPELLKFSCLS